MTDTPPPPADASVRDDGSPDGSPDLDFDPVRLRPRHDGWTPERQTEFIEALAESGCVQESCKRVGMSATSAYALRRQVAAQSFRLAWDAALDYAIRRLSDAALGRALNGVANPIFFQGQQIGERRHYDERLTMFLLRYRDPVQYGAWRDQYIAQRHPEAAATTVARMADRVADDAWAEAFGDPPPRHPPLTTLRMMTVREAAEDEDRADQRRAAVDARREEAARAAREKADDDWDDA